MSKTLQEKTSAGASSDAALTLAPKQRAPMLCKLATPSSGERLDDAGRLYELKLDGVRIVAVRDGDRVTLTYRSGRDATRVYPEVTTALAAVGEASFVLDGEIVALDAEGRPSFERLQRRIAAETGDVARAARDVPVAYLVFDALLVAGRDVRALPLEARKDLVRALLPARSLAIPHEGHVGKGAEIFALCVERGLEGVVGKRLGSPYRPGERTTDWVKWKTTREADFVVVGYTEGGASGQLGALDLASYEGSRLVVRGKAGSGLTDALVAQLLPVLRALAVKEAPAEGPWEKEPRTYVQPRLVVSVRYGSWSSDGRLRWPVFLGIRPDLEPASCVVGPSSDER